MPERKVTHSETAPSNPNTGDGWIHITTRVEKIWDGSAWEVVSATKSGTIAATLGSNSVTFNTPFASTPRVVLSVQDASLALRDCLYKVTAVSTTGFSFDTDAGATYSWIATDAGDP